MRRGDNSVKPRPFCEARKGDGTGGGGAGNAHAAQRLMVHARQYRDSEQCWPIFLVGEGFSRGAHHGEPAQGMDVYHPHLWQVRRRGDCSCDRIGDIVELEVEECFKAQVREPFNRPRAFRREELKPDLEQACRTPKAPRQGAGRPQAVDVQGYD